MIDIYI